MTEAGRDLLYPRDLAPTGREPRVTDGTIGAGRVTDGTAYRPRSDSGLSGTAPTSAASRSATRSRCAPGSRPVSGR